MTKQDMCQGDYTPFTDYVRSRVSCVSSTLPALKCILEGVQNIPGPPEVNIPQKKAIRSL